MFFSGYYFYLKQRKNQMPKGKSSRKKRPDFNITIADSSQHSCTEKIRTLTMKKAEALDILKGSHNPSQINFRDKQIFEITKCIKMLLEDNNKSVGKCKVLMLTGSPGAGKTLCANYILKKLPYKIVNLNANLVKNLKEVQAILTENLLPEETLKQLSTFQLVSKLQQSCLQPFILYIEQVELLLKCVPDIFSEDFFSLFSNKKLRIMLLGISNTIDTLQKYSERLKIKIPQITNIVFQPYTYEEIKDLMKGKFDQVFKKTDIEITFSQNLLKFVAKKLEGNRKGDLRIVFEFLKQIGSIILYKNYDNDNNQQIVSIDIINQVLNKIQSGRDKLLNQMSLQPAIILVAIYSRIKRLEEILISEKDLKFEIKQVYEGLNMNSQKDAIQESLSLLQTYGFISEKKKSNSQKKYLLKVNIVEIQAAFKNHPILKKFILDKQN